MGPNISVGEFSQDGGTIGNHFIQITCVLGDSQIQSLVIIPLLAE